MSESSSNDYSRVMKRDWNERARENAKWYINTVRVQQDEAEFDETGRAEVDKLLRAELGFLTQGREPRTLRLLEIGCGIGRMTKHLAALFGEVHAVDVSGEMIRQARERLRDLPNVHCHETSGCDFAALPDDYFDLVFSAYVFQHVPSAMVIRANLVDAFRVLKPGGVCKFGVNSTMDAAFLQQEHDTWTGAALPENELRQTARELGAQLLRLDDPGTQYCWVTWRKPLYAAGQPTEALQIVEAGRADSLDIKHLPISGDQARLGLLVSGWNNEAANAVSVVINGQTVLPDVVLPMQGAMPALHLIVASLPAGLTIGPAEAYVELTPGRPSNIAHFMLCEPAAKTPEIVTVRNASDYGTDVHTSGPKAWVMLYVKYLPDAASIENVRLQVGERVIEPSYVGADARFGGHQVNLQIPPETPVGSTELRLLFQGAVSPGVRLHLEAPAEP